MLHDKEIYRKRFERKRVFLLKSASCYVLIVQ